MWVIRSEIQTFLHECCVALSLWRVDVSGKKDQWLKVGSGTTPALHWMNIWLKRCLSTLSQRLLCFKASRHNIRGGGGGAGGKTVNAAPWLPPSLLSLLLCFSFFAPLHTPSFPSLPSICLCSFCAVSLCECYHSAEKHLSDCCLRLCLSLCCLHLYEEKCFDGFHHHYCHN